MKLLLLAFGKPALTFMAGLVGLTLGATNEGIELEPLPAPELEGLEIDEDEILRNPDFHRSRIPVAPEGRALPDGSPVPETE